MLRMTRLLGFCSLIGAAVLLAGCGESGPPMGTVTGKVTLDGKALNNALVTFTPEGGATPSTGKTTEEGQYELIYMDRKGALVGNHTVAVTVLAETPATITEMKSDDPNY